MGLTLIDWILVAAYFVFSALIGVLYARRAGRSTEQP
jgi:Na+/proline symporter